MLPPTPCPLLLAPAAACSCFWPGPNPPRSTTRARRRGHGGVQAGGCSIPPGDAGTLPWPGPTSLQTRRQDALILFSVSMATASFPSPFQQPDPLLRPPAAPSPTSTHPALGTQAATHHGPLLWGLSWVAMPPAQHLRAGPNPAPWCPPRCRWAILGEQLAGLARDWERARRTPTPVGPSLTPAIISSSAGRILRWFISQGGNCPPALPTRGRRAASPAGRAKLINGTSYPHTCSRLMCRISGTPARRHRRGGHRHRSNAATSLVPSPLREERSICGLKAGL